MIASNPAITQTDAIESIVGKDLIYSWDNRFCICRIAFIGNGSTTIL